MIGLIVAINDFTNIIDAPSTEQEMQHLPFLVADENFSLDTILVIDIG